MSRNQIPIDTNSIFQPEPVTTSHTYNKITAESPPRPQIRNRHTQPNSHSTKQPLHTTTRPNFQPKTRRIAQQFSNQRTKQTTQSLHKHGHKSEPNTRKGTTIHHNLQFMKQHKSEPSEGNKVFFFVL